MILNLNCILLDGCVSYKFKRRHHYYNPLGITQKLQDIMGCDKIGIDAFDLLFNGLKHNYDAYFTNVYTTLATIVLAIGWILTSKAAREFLSQNLIIRKVAIMGIVAITIIHFANLIYMSFKSDQIKDQLDLYTQLVLEVKESNLYDMYHIDWYYPTISCILNGILFTILIFIIIRTGEKNIKQ
ncbi:MAG: hypothetical protein ACEPOZ_20670 [Marinifilaceae bacterium]